ncbi:MAG TPA: aminoglycoside phosphotransferase [Spongiibacteraceae bacterium]|nr:aminoglycoside phosphotransferase [Spongiibacteraceae bacterium]HCS27570.1 aminoglycoside phosphotransferase [Spongiibacteraceae bacterium]
MSDRLRQWCAAQLAVAEEQLSPLENVAGDASFRRYYRTRLADGRSYIVMDAPPDKEDSQPFIDVARRLRGANVHAPEILASDLQKGWLLLEDLGDDLYKKAFEQGDGDVLMTQIFDVLESQAGRVSCEGLPAYDRERLQVELDLFPDWYLGRQRMQPFTEEEQSQWDDLCALLCRNAAAQPQVFVHRDFHSCNLMVLGAAAPGVIDFQDAVCGPITYDLMSILLDRYITWPRAQLESWMNTFRRRVAPEVEPEEWLRWCDWMGLQRNLKIIGIFARLSHRDGKSGYLELIPRFADYVRDVLMRYSELQSYRTLLEHRL